MARKQGCLLLLKRWANERKASVKDMVSVKVPSFMKHAPASEMCMRSRCADRRIRAFAIDKRHNTAAIAFTDERGCHFAAGRVTEVLSADLRQTANLGGVKKSVKKRKR